MSDKGRAKGIMIALKRVGKNKEKRTEEEECTNRINEMNKMLRDSFNLKGQTDKRVSKMG